MKPYIKYLTFAFVLLMAYSQIFTYVYLGVISSPSARIADGVVGIHAPLDNSNILDNAIIEETTEENKDDREALHINFRGYNDIALLFSSIDRVEPRSFQPYRFTPFQYHTLATDAYIRFRVFKV